MKCWSHWMIFWLLLGVRLQAQSTFQVQGKVLLDAQTPGTGVVVQLMSHDTLKMLGYHVTGSNGDFQITLKNWQDTMVLKASYLGYQPYFLRFCSNNPQAPLSIRLVPDVRSLPEILVQGASTGIKTDGDTTRYQLEQWRTGREKNLGDLINALPGLETNEQGKVMYQGKPVEVLLLEDKEIVGQQHDLITKGLSADEVVGLEIINEFKNEAQQFKGEHSQKHALRIQLKNGQQSKWLKHLMAAGGPDKKAEADGSLLHTNKNTGWSVLAKTNTIGQPLLTPTDYLELQTDLVRFLLQNQSKDLQNILPPALHVPESMQRNLDFLANTHLDWKPGKQLQIKSSTFWTQLQRNAAADLVGYLPNSGTTYQANEMERTRFQMVQHQTAFSFQPNSRHMVEVFLPMEWNKSFTGASIASRLNASAQQVNFQHNTSLFQTSPDLQWSVKKGQAWTFIANTQWRYIQRPLLSGVGAAQNLFDTPFMQVDQQGRTIERETLIKCSIRYRKGIQQVTLEGSHLNNLQNLRWNSNVLIFEGSDQWKHSRNSVRLTWWLKDVKWEARNYLEMVHSRFSHVLGQSKGFWYAQPSVFIKYHFKPLQQLSWSAGSARSVPSFQQLSPIGVITDAYQYRIGWGDSLFLPLRWSAQLFYFHLNGLQKNTTTASLQWSTLRSSFATWLNAQTNYLIEQTGWTEAGNSFSAKWDNSKELEGKRKWLIQIHVLQQDWPLLNETGPLSQRWQLFSASTAIKQSKGLGWNWRLAYSWRWNKMQGPMFQQDQYSHWHQPGMDLSYQTRQWLFEFNLENFVLITQENTLYRPLIQARMQWQPKKGQWYFGVRGSDLLYLNGTRVQGIQFQPNQIMFSTFRRFPGFVLLYAERYW